MIVLGIDPGTATLGYGVVETSGTGLRAIDHGAIETDPRLPLPERLLQIDRALAILIERHRPAIAGVERLFFTSNVQSALAVGQARGVVLVAAARAGIPVREATPSAIKSAVTGHGRADKSGVGLMVQRILGLDAVPTPDDAADALAIAIWAANAESTTEAGARSGGGQAASSVLDRAAVAPIAGQTPYERAVAEALKAERATAGRRGRSA